MAPSTGARPGSDALIWVLAVAGALVVAIGAPTNQSFWIDEAHTVWTASQPTLADWWTELLAERGSDLQMPLYMLYAWAWEKALGSGEWWMRAANAPWLMLGLLALARGRAALFATALISPFVWYYAGEARPYAMQIGAGLLVFAALDRLYGSMGRTLSRDDRVWGAALACGLVLLSGSSMVGMYWAGAAVCVGLTIFPKRDIRRLVFGLWPLSIATTIALAGFAAYYLWTLKSGAGAYAGSPTGLRNLLFIGYELLGFSGLGPGRLEIRASGLASFADYLMPLAVYGSLLVALFWVTGRTVLRSGPRRVLVGAGLVVGVAALVLLATGHLRHIRLLGRHFAPLLAVALWPVAEGLSALWRRRRSSFRAVVVASVALSLLSSILLRIAPRHARDAYRESATTAVMALERDEIVWWSADLIGGRLYGVPLGGATPEIAGEARPMVNCDRSNLDRAPKPDLVIASKPDLYDANGELAEYLARNHYFVAGALPAFLLWRRHGADDGPNLDLGPR